jgi:hypothetical protein
MSVLLMLASACAIDPAASHAAMALSYQETASGIIGTGAVSVLPTPGSYVYADSFASPSGGNIGVGTEYGFYDDFLFQISDASVDAITSTINLSGGSSDLLAIDDLSVRLYSISGNAPPVLNNPNGGAIDGWSTPVNAGPGTTAVINVLPWTALQSGTYVLEMRGTVTGSAGGGYSGVLNVAPVPVPAALPMMLGGLGVLSGFLHRCKSV